MTERIAILESRIEVLRRELDAAISERDEMRGERDHLLEVCIERRAEIQGLRDDNAKMFERIKELEGR